MKKFVVHIAETKDFSEEVISRLKRFAEVKTDAVNQNTLAQALNTCDVFWFRLAFKIKSESLSAGMRCKFILCPVTGLDHIDLEACREFGIQVLSLRGEVEFLKTIRATAEHTLGLTLTLLRHIYEAVAHVNRFEWNRDLFKGREIYGKKVGILGVGRLGTITSRYFQAMGAEVWGYDIKPYEIEGCHKARSPEQLFELADILSIHLAYNDTTQHYINKAMLERMQRHAVLINTSRGGIVKSDDLVWALKNKIIAGAALDVLEYEPDIHGNPLIAYARENRNLIITPHIGGNTFESFSRTELFLCKKLEEALALTS
ncbi:MAG: NAD(P)-dependent oxidoreductase [Bacteroidota bacterium]